uniref:Uncharacterized protein n=1 Tax=Chlamydia pneumoniae TaxID=83558 RepID=A0A0F7YR11_CHLPN|nr:Uncharacterized protein BN1224_YK41_BI_00080 [Chlamydia pneumoniae]
MKKQSTRKTSSIQNIFYPARNTTNRNERNIFVQDSFKKIRKPVCFIRKQNIIEKIFFTLRFLCFEFC